MATKPMASTNHKKATESIKSPHILGMALIGVGLLFLSAVAVLLLPRLAAGSESVSVGLAEPQEDDGIIPPAKISFPAPDLRLEDLSGAELSLSDHLGEVVLVNNWAVWCPPCKAEMPVLQAYYEAHRDQGFTLIGIEAGSPLSEVQAYLADYDFTFPIWLDPEVKALKAFKNFNLPSSYVIDRDGNVALVWYGQVNRESLELYITPMLEE